MSTRDAFGGCVTSHSAVGELGKAGGRRPHALRQGLGARQAPRARRALRHRYSPFNVIITHFRLLLRRVLAHLNRIIPHRRIIVRESKSIKWRLVV